MKNRVFYAALAAGWVLMSSATWADEPTLPGEGFNASRYEALWTKSPFSVSSAEAAPDSPDYALVGIARFDGIFYASLIDQKTQEHFLISTGKPARGLTLISVTPGHGNSDTFAMVQKDGQPLTLKMQAAAANAGVAPNSNPNATAPAPGVQMAQPAPGSVVPAPGAPPQVRRRPHGVIVLPPRPSPQ